mgnify:CR=1 FL=1
MIMIMIMIMILDDLILTYKASVVLISDASTSASNTRKLSSGFGSFWMGLGRFGSSHFLVTPSTKAAAEKVPSTLTRSKS